MGVITISRQFGAGGRTLGQLLSERLGYTLVDEYLVELVAQHANVSPALVKNVEKEPAGNLLRYVSGLKILRRRYIDPLVDKRNYIDGHIYVQLVDKIIRGLAAEDNVIIIDRGGQYILKDHPNALHLLLIAEKEDRISFMQKNYNLERAHAEQVIAMHDKTRINLFRYFGSVDYDNPLLYHTVLNTSRLDLQVCQENIARMVQALQPTDASCS